MFDHHPARPRLSKARLAACAALLLPVLLTGCAGTGSKLARSESPLDFARSAAGGKHAETLPVELAPACHGTIATAHAHADARGLLVQGTLKKSAVSGKPDPAWTHVDVTLFDRRGRVLQTASTRFTAVRHRRQAMDIPSRFSVRLGDAPPTAAKIRVSLHRAPKNECAQAREHTQAQGNSNP